MITILQSPSARQRLEAAARFLDSLPAATEVLLVGASREAADDFAREGARRRGVVFGLHRFSFVQLAARTAAGELAEKNLAPATGLGMEAIAARAAFDAAAAKALRRFGPVALRPGFPRALAATLNELRGASVEPEGLTVLGEPASDLRNLAERYEDGLAAGRLADRAALFRLATLAASERRGNGWPIVFLDVAIHSAVEREFVRALIAHAPEVFATVPAGDDDTVHAFSSAPRGQPADIAVVTVSTGRTDAPPPDQPPILSRLQAELFGVQPPGEARTIESDIETCVEFFSAPGEGRESVEIARRLMDEARRGTPFDRMAVLLRAPRLYAGLLETALRRAGIPAYFARGTLAPDPSGRAFLALLLCAREGLSAKRFAEYLSIGQVPLPDRSGAPPTNREIWAAPDDYADETLAVARGDEEAGPRQGELFATDGADPPPVSPDAPVVEGTLRAPWKWERLMVEAAVVGGHERWARRLGGLRRELEIKVAALGADEPESPRVSRLERDLRQLDHLRRFALPVIDALASLPPRATWGAWLGHLERLAPRVLRRPERVLAVLAELRPMSAVGPIALAEVVDVLADPLAQVQQPPPERRYGRVFIGTPDQARGRDFAVVALPGLAERIFPQKPRQDPLLLDADRSRLGAALRLQADRGQGERLLLRLAVGSSSRRLLLSYPRMELGESRPRVPSFYALDVWRAATGRVPDFETLEREATQAAGARLAWPAPLDPARAIDSSEHDLAVIGSLMRHPRAEETKGRARYLFELNGHLRRSLRARWARWEPKWSPYDGLCGPTEATVAALGRERLRARPYSVSALQKFAVCPYQFLLSAIYRLEPREDSVPLERMDPLTRGHMFHRVQAELLRELKQARLVPVSVSRLFDARTALDRTLDRVAAEYREQLAPAIERVWKDEVESMRADLRGWLQRLAEAEGDWEPLHVEFGFGFPPGEGRDPESRAEPVVLEGGWQLHGVIDLIEHRPGAAGVRVTDHKTGRNRTKEDMVVGGGETLQPVLYTLAVEAALHRPVAEARLSFCTSAGAFQERKVPVGDKDDSRRRGLEVLEIVDRAIERAVLPPAPRERACRWCDFIDVCGSSEEARIRKKPEHLLDDLKALRQMP